MPRKNNKQASPRAIKVDPWTTIQHWNISARGALEVDITEYRSGQNVLIAWLHLFNAHQMRKIIEVERKLEPFRD